jgi:hypothetical protein
MITKSEPWSWVHKQLVEIPAQKAYKPYIYKRKSALFNQLIVSWNAMRPAEGYFSFWGRVRDAQTQKWYPWHKMFVWGTSPYGSLIQRSFLDNTTVGTQYLHVRLELPTGRFADAFAIQVQSHKGASLQLLKSITANTVNLTLFKPESTKLARNLSSVPRIKNIPRYSQRFDHPRALHMCSPTSTAMLTSYFTKRFFHPLEFASYVYDRGLDTYGSWPFNTAHAFVASKGTISYHVQRLNSFRELHTLLKKAIPVVVSVRGPLRGCPPDCEYKNGHLLAVVGFNQKTKEVLVHDPAFTLDAVATKYKLADFLPAWERSRRLAYVAERLKA